jgi:drug/metabolite transporter (DMT)-like permease
VIGAALAWAIDDNLARRLERSNALAIAGWKGLVAGTTSVLLAALLGEGLPGPAFLVGLAAGALGYGLSVAWFVAAQRDLGTARTAAYFGTAPLIGALAAIAAGARPNPLAFTIALGLTVAGVALHLGERHDHEHRHGDLVHAHPHAPDREHRHAHS